MNRKSAIAVVLLVAAVFGALHFSHASLQQDDYFHVRYAWMMRAHGPLFEFPWMKFTVQNEHFVDKHFLFHALLVPFTFGDPVVSAKIASIASLGLLALVLFWFFSHHGVRHPFFWTCFFFAASRIGMVRLMAIRPIALSFVLLILGMHCLFRKKTLWLGGVALAFGYLYSAFPVFLGMVLLFTATDALYRRRLDLKPLGSAVLGSAISVIANPYFPDNVKMMAVQYLRTSVVRSEFGQNMEWIPFGMWDMLFHAWPLWIALFVVFLLAITRGRSFRFETLALFVQMCVGILVFLKMSRGIDQCLPFAVLFLAFTFSDMAPRIGRISAVLILLVTIGFSAINAWQAGMGFKAMERIDNRGAALWLKENAPKGSDVFITNFGAFPQLFFHDQEQYYTLGLDPLYMKERDPALWQAYQSAVSLAADPYPIIKETFGAEYVHAEYIPTNRAFIGHLVSRPDRYRTVFRDDWSVVFEVR